MEGRIHEKEGVKDHGPSLYSGRTETAFLQIYIRARGLPPSYTMSHTHNCRPGHRSWREMGKQNGEGPTQASWAHEGPMVCLCHSLRSSIRVPSGFRVGVRGWVGESGNI